MICKQTWMVLLGVIFFAATAPAAAPAPSAKSKGAAAIKQAIDSLSKEYQAYLKDPTSSRIRAKSNYFIENPSPDATPENIVKALEGTVSGGREVEAYVKWQLLSGVSGKFPDDLVKRVVAVYRRAPGPAAEHPGMDRRTLDGMARRIRKEEMASYNKEFGEAVERFKNANDVYLDYRNELFSHLPGNKTDVMYAGLEDVALRASHGIGSQGLMDNVAAGMRTWAIADAKSGEARTMAGTVAQLREQYADYKPYTKLADEKGMIKWQGGNPPLDGKKLDELANFLANTTSTASGGGLKFKDK
jgi:hypothetical protein